MLWNILFFSLCFVGSRGVGRRQGGKEEQSSFAQESYGVFSDPIVAGPMPDNVAEMYNFLDGDSFGIGPMHEFVYGWQSIVNVLSTKNNIEVRKRAGLQRFSLAGINGVSLVSHAGVTEIMMNGTRTYCFGGVHRPVGLRSAICRGPMYQEGRFSCRTSYLRYANAEGYQHCISEFAVVKDYNGTATAKGPQNAHCINGESVPYFHHSYICERRLLQVRNLNLSDPVERASVRNPAVRRLEYYRSPYDVLRLCADWYGCDLQLYNSIMHNEQQTGILNANETAFVGHGGKYWLALYYSKLSDWAVYFQTHTDLIWHQKKPPSAKGESGIWKKLRQANIGPDMSIHYNNNGIYNGFVGSPDLLKNDEVLPWGMRQNEHDQPEKIGAVGAEELEDFIEGGTNYIHNTDVKPSFQGLRNV